ncbi:unnamed protein product [Notodromas monacha]|uniref:Uncharacterized protein n=1 Tax=Notodromas monacha TaxID=399045 RepID=A0A7R9GAE4_9CRUS|nr:unnamed protein product [Notodromas monacha]CAG0913612.1 unnamed protein product [Notodromas monacha]
MRKSSHDYFGLASQKTNISHVLPLGTVFQTREGVLRKPHLVPVTYESVVDVARASRVMPRLLKAVVGRDVRWWLKIISLIGMVTLGIYSSVLSVNQHQLRRDAIFVLLVASVALHVYPSSYTIV